MNERPPFPVEFKQREQRSVAQAMFNGFCDRCPSCGNRGLFARFLKTEDRCNYCGTEFHHHRADDLPAYLVVLILGHIMVGLVLLVQEVADFGIWQQLSVIAPLSVVIAVLLLKPTKGAVVGLQWALRMHGFGEVQENGANVNRRRETETDG
jgi:uncharacterized protein (DUF983 family)